jgi:hypothetical protein
MLPQHGSRRHGEYQIMRVSSKDLDLPIRAHVDGVFQPAAQTAVRIIQTGLDGNYNTGFEAVGFSGSNAKPGSFMHRQT